LVKLIVNGFLPSTEIGFSDCSWFKPLTIKELWPEILSHLRSLPLVPELGSGGDVAKETFVDQAKLKTAKIIFNIQTPITPPLRKAYTVVVIGG